MDEEEAAKESAHELDQTLPQVLRRTLRLGSSDLKQSRDSRFRSALPSKQMQRSPAAGGVEARGLNDLLPPNERDD